jgi:hypothetical protein
MQSPHKNDFKLNDTFDLFYDSNSKFINHQNDQLTNFHDGQNPQYQSDELNWSNNSLVQLLTPKKKTSSTKKDSNYFSLKLKHKIQQKKMMFKKNIFKNKLKSGKIHFISGQNCFSQKPSQISKKIFKTKNHLDFTRMIGPRESYVLSNETNYEPNPFVSFDDSVSHCYKVISEITTGQLSEIKKKKILTEKISYEENKFLFKKKENIKSEIGTAKETTLKNIQAEFSKMELNL